MSLFLSELQIKKEDVKECVNSAFADLCLMWERYEEEKGTLRNYLCTIAGRKALERHRKNDARQRAEERGLKKVLKRLPESCFWWLQREDSN